ncbi:MAG: DUF5615 family PIN-like protein [Saprospiraceae bacterium]|nr:DUF5615 family PIN-like protein [Saprospiraceae bacterium]
MEPNDKSLNILLISNDIMMILFDQNISFRILKKLSPYFTNCKHASQYGLMDCDDLTIRQYAKKMNFIMVTFDSDFFDYSILYGHPPKIILA